MTRKNTHFYGKMSVRYNALIHQLTSQACGFHQLSSLLHRLDDKGFNRTAPIFMPMPAFDSSECTGFRIVQ